MAKNKTDKYLVDYSMKDIDKVEINIGDELFLSDLGTFTSPKHRFLCVYIERIVYGPDIVLYSNGEWVTMWEAKSVKLVSEKSLDYIKPRIYHTIPRNSYNMLLPVPSNATIK